MDPLLVVWGAMIALGATYWWEQKLTAIMGDDGLSYSFNCLATAGLNGCPVQDYANLSQDNWVASVFFYLGVFLFLYTIIFPKPPMPPQCEH
jgi:hypothetical protein